MIGRSLGTVGGAATGPVEASRRVVRQAGEDCEKTGWSKAESGVSANRYAEPFRHVGSQQEVFLPASNRIPGKNAAHEHDPSMVLAHV